MQREDLTKNPALLIINNNNNLNNHNNHKLSV